MGQTRIEGYDGHHHPVQPPGSQGWGDVRQGMSSADSSGGGMGDNRVKDEGFIVTLWRGPGGPIYIVFQWIGYKNRVTVLFMPVRGDPETLG